MKTFNINNVLKKTEISKAVAADSMLRETVSKAFLLDVILGEITQTITKDFDLLIQKQAIPKETDIDTLLDGEKQKQVLLDICLRETEQLQKQLDVIIKAIYQSAFQADLFLEKEEVKTYGIDVYLGTYVPFHGFYATFEISTITATFEVDSMTAEIEDSGMTAEFEIH